MPAVLVKGHCGMTIEEIIMQPKTELIQINYGVLKIKTHLRLY